MGSICGRSDAQRNENASHREATTDCGRKAEEKHAGNGWLS